MLSVSNPYTNILCYRNHISPEKLWLLSASVTFCWLFIINKSLLLELFFADRYYFTKLLSMNCPLFTRNIFFWYNQDQIEKHGNSNSTAQWGLESLESWLNFRLFSTSIEFHPLTTSLLSPFSCISGRVRLDPGGHLRRAVLWYLSSTAVQVMANVEPFVQGDRSHLARQPRSDGSHCHVQ